jgi:hypothetical protein
MRNFGHLREKAGAKRLHAGSKQAQNGSLPASFGAKGVTGYASLVRPYRNSRAGHRVGRTLTQYQLRLPPSGCEGTRWRRKNASCRPAWSTLKPVERNPKDEEADKFIAQAEAPQLSAPYCMAKFLLLQDQA